MGRAVTTVPRVGLSLAGAPLGGEAWLQGWDVVHHANAPAECVLQIAEPDIGQAADWQDDAPVSLQVDDRPLFQGGLTASRWQLRGDGRRVCELRAADGLRALADAQTVRVFDQQSSLAIIETVVGAHGLRVVGEAGPRWQRWYQLQHSDLETLVQVSARGACWFRCVDDEVALFGREGVGAAGTVGPEELLEADCVRNALACAGSVRVAGSLVREAGELDGRSRPGLAAYPGAGERLLPGLCADDDDQLDALAEHLHAGRRLAAQAMQLLVHGDADWLPGRPLALRVDGLPQRDAVVFAVQHRGDSASGFTTRLDTRPPPPPGIERDCQFFIGVVVAVDDPDHLGRVRVRLPACSDLDTHWLPVLAPAAAADKGLVAMPGVDDRVALLAPGRELAHAVVLGGIHTAGGAYDRAGIVGTAPKRYHFRSPDGHRLSLDEAAGELVLEHAGGSHLTMGRSQVELEAKGSLSIKAPGQALTITAASVDFQRG